MCFIRSKGKPSICEIKLIVPAKIGLAFLSFAKHFSHKTPPNERLNRALKGKALLPGKRILAFTGRDLLNSLNVELVKGVEKAGVEIYRDTCMVVSPLDMMGVSRAGTDSGKAAHYLPRMSRISTELMPIEMIIENATGPR